MEAKKPTRDATIVVCITRSCWSSGKWVKKLELSLEAKSPQGLHYCCISRWSSCKWVKKLELIFSINFNF